MTINPSQVQLLRREASRLRARRQALSEAIAGADEPLKQATVDLLRGSLQQELESLKTTESKFGELGSKVQAEATRVFFDDLRLSYTGVLSGLGQETVGRSNVTMMRAAWSLPPQTTPVDSNRHSLTTQSVFEIIELNARAYALVADAEALTFDLDVKSNPEGAIVSYRRRGDAYKDHPSPTNSTIRFLTYAIWTVRFRKKGYEEQEFEFNPFVESNHVISVNLVK